MRIELSLVLYLPPLFPLVISRIQHQASWLPTALGQSEEYQNHWPRCREWPSYYLRTLAVTRGVRCMLGCCIQPVSCEAPVSFMLPVSSGTVFGSKKYWIFPPFWPKSTAHIAQLVVHKALNLVVVGLRLTSRILLASFFHILPFSCPFLPFFFPFLPSFLPF